MSNIALFKRFSDGNISAEELSKFSDMLFIGIPDFTDEKLGIRIYIEAYCGEGALALSTISGISQSQVRAVLDKVTK